MTLDELRDLYTEATKIIRAEKRAREWVFRDKPQKQGQKMAEMDRLEAILTRLKDELKPHCDPEIEQPALFDMPTPAKYV